MDHQLGTSHAYYSLKRLGLQIESEDALSPMTQLHPNNGLLTDSDCKINYINKILLEDIDENTDDLLICDPIALRATENYFYEALGENPSFDNKVKGREDTLVGSSTCDADPGESMSCGTSDPPHLSMHSSSPPQANLDGLNSSLHRFGGRANVVPNLFFDDQIMAISQFERGVEESRRFFHAINPMVIHLDDKYIVHPNMTDELISGSTVSIEKGGHLVGSCKGRKHDRPGEGEEERSWKQSAAYGEEVELSEVFDKVLLCADDNDDCPPSRARKRKPKGKNGQYRCSKKDGDVSKKVNVVSLLLTCANNVGDADYNTAVKQLKEIRQYSSPDGDANQRLAHAFADGLEARMAGTWTQIYPLSSFRNEFIVSELQKSHMSSSLPFMRIIIFFANKMIYEVASRGKSLHVIDLGILYGIQWPTLIRDLSQRPGGPPKLRITGIEHPQSGFHSSQMVVETGCRLAKYCESFGVPFEYNAITATNWETIKIGDLKLERGEVVVVNCIDRFKLLLDETVCGEDNPRDDVLKLIRDVNPQIFVHSVMSSSHTSPFFINRFREALHFGSAIFDMFATIFPHHDSHRLNFEQTLMRPTIANVIACEGRERFDRPETYKLWQLRTMRAGFKPLPLNSQLVKKLRAQARETCHKDILFDEDGPWLLQGWKGRIILATSAWIPKQ
ncbi:unnamed protein product [Cuscuta epithymum]|uniref:Uncharacterized protein n=1 Tax=Cuscuta epithymum TaxID=186058 RepID=A0AAV0G493_9ASTE|nr:unnamed protein product [Cuscuta epithymum]CAH9142403.1 unnamed protein product [Cuscuta epithymum]